MEPAAYIFRLKAERQTSSFFLKVKAVCGSYSTAPLRHIVLLPE